MSTMTLIGGEAVTTRLAMRMEDSLQAFAVRAACFIGELEVPFSEEFDGHDFGATHVIAPALPDARLPADARVHIAGNFRDAAR